jgi:eukaryotic-like serine/threonine-protein kinase
MLGRPMSEALRDEVSGEAMAAREPRLESSAITDDPFLAEVARIPARAGVPPSDPPLRPGDAVGRFVVVSELGRGGMGVVYAAEDRTLGRTVALKVLLPTEDDRRRRRFLREARAAAAISHPGIAVVYEISEIDGRVVIAMELVRGRTLRARLAEGVLPVAEAARVGRAIASALGRAHERGVVHRDLKPENVMIGDDGQIKLLDFGLAKPIVEGGAELGTATTATEDGRLVGTPSYMSPEQAKSRPVDARSDVFSFGVMLYEMLTGRRPFAGPTVIELFIALDRDEPAPPSQVNPRVPAAIERVVLRCLQKDPAARYADGGALLADLDRAASPRSSRFGRIAAAAIAVLAIAAAGAGALVMRRAPPWVPVPITDLPAPRSSRPEAVAAYQASLASMREGASPGDGLRRALELDPDLAEAHLQMVPLAMEHRMETARAHFRRAEELRSALGERDRAMLDAFEPLVQRQPADWAETNRRLEAALTRFAGDVELWYLLGLGRANYDDMEASVRDFRRAIELDPAFAPAYASMGMDLAYLGRFDEALGAVDRCLAVRPGSEACLRIATRVYAARGECDAMEGTTRRMLAAGSEAYFAYPVLADALAAGDRPIATVREAIRQADVGLALLPPGITSDAWRKQRSAVLRMDEASFEGDFEASARVAGEYAPIVEASRQQNEHGVFARELGRVYLEMGRPADAARLAVDFLDRRDAWEPAPGAEDTAMAGDATPFLLLTALRAGAISRADFEARRDAFRRAWKARVTPVSRSFLWFYGYAAMVDGPDDARAALEALPEYAPLPPFCPSSLAEVDVGRTFLLGGRTDEAIAWLERATRGCFALHFPLEHAQAFAWLGQAREAKGDARGACAAYREVIARWGQAKPRSVTADHARARVAALACPG